MVFAFNCVTVLLILIELTRYFFKDEVPYIKTTFENYFKSYCDAREKAPDALIVTHIFLLIGYLTFFITHDIDVLCLL